MGTDGTRPGVYDWSEMDAHIKMANENGYRLLWVCHGVPEWSLPKEVLDKPRPFANYAPSDIDEIRPFLRKFWERYGNSGVVGAVEIGNEPNAHPGWPPDKYAMMGRAVYEETHKATKGIRVIGICMSGGTHIEYMENALNDGLDKNMDIASLHLYEIANPIGDRSIERKTRLFMEKLREHGLGDLPVWNTESGCPMQMRQDGVILSQEDLNRQIIKRPEFDSSMAWRVGSSWRGPSELLGAAWMIRASYQQFTMGVEKNFMFEWSGSPHFSWVYDWRPGGNVLPKIIVVATGVMSKMLLDYGSSPTAEQPKVESSSAGWLAFAHRFQGPKGRMTIVYVQPDIYAGSGDQVAALAAGDDDVKAKITESNVQSPWLRTSKPDPVIVQVPVVSEEVTVVDMFGKKTTRSMKAVNGIVEIKAAEEPQYIIETR